LGLSRRLVLLVAVGDYSVGRCVPPAPQPTILTVIAGAQGAARPGRSGDTP
jgi:hypothetical protein